MLILQSLKLLWLSQIPNVHLHIINMLFHVGFFSSAFFLAKLGYFHTARIILILSYVSYLIAAISLWHSDLNIQFYFLLGMFACLYFFHPLENVGLWINLCIFCGLFIYFQNFHVYSTHHFEWQLNVLRFNSVTLAASCFLCAIWIRQQMNKQSRKIQIREQKTRLLLQKVIPDHLVTYLVLAKTPHIRECIAEHTFVSIIFIDFTQFTPFSRQTSDKNLVLFLHELFSNFDNVAEKHQIVKIKTNGDQYIAAAGLENTGISAYETSQKACEFALEIRSAFSQQTEAAIGIKIGIASGNAISGIIGTLRPAFDLWGNTMNLASRLESSANDGEIQVCQQSMLYSMQHYKFCSGFPIQLKGLGPVVAHKLLDKK